MCPNARNISSDMCAQQRVTLRKHAYSNTLKILPPKNENFQIKNSDVSHISAQNIDCGYSLEPPRLGESMFLSKNKKNNVYPCKPKFYYIRVGFKGSKLYRRVFMMRSACAFAESDLNRHWAHFGDSQ